MNTRTILQKLKSTKLWCAIAGIARTAARPNTAHLMKFFMV